MIVLDQPDTSMPYKVFLDLLKKAEESNQQDTDIITISSFDKKIQEVQSRYVNLKYIKKNQWIFFSNYNSPKAMSFKEHNQISALMYWNKIKTQIRMKAIISKADTEISDNHFHNRDISKNAIAICSNQSQKIESHERFQEIFYDTFNKLKLKHKKSRKILRPSHWGGFSFIPYYFEFWQGHPSRANKRDVYVMNEKKWNHFIIQP